MYENLDEFFKNNCRSCGSLFITFNKDQTICDYCKSQKDRRSADDPYKTY